MKKEKSVRLTMSETIFVLYQFSGQINIPLGLQSNQEGAER